MAKKRPAYDDLVLRPLIIAGYVMAEPYTGQEVSARQRSGKTVEEVEAARKKMSKVDQSRFIRFCDDKCRDAYEANAQWFMRCVDAKGNKGRDQLIVWMSHWLSSFLFKKEMVEPNAIKLADFSLKNIKTFKGREGEGFNADILLKGKKIAFASDGGDGGEMRIDWVGGKFREIPPVVMAFLHSEEGLKHSNEREGALRAQYPELYTKEPMLTRWCEADFIEYLLERHELDRLAKRHGFIFCPKGERGKMMYYKHPKGTKWTRKLLGELIETATAKHGPIEILAAPELST